MFVNLTSIDCFQYQPDVKQEEQNGGSIMPEEDSCVIAHADCDEKEEDDSHDVSETETPSINKQKIVFFLLGHPSRTPTTRLGGLQKKTSKGIG